MQLPTASDLRAALAAGPPLLLDGAMGSQLLASGFDLARDYLEVEDGVEVLNLTRPEQVRAVHESWFDAGCDLATTNTFMALPSVLTECGQGARLNEIVAAAVREARAAAEAWSDEDRPRWVLGGAGPGTDLPTKSGRSRAAVEADYDALLRRLTSGRVDGLLIETCADPIQIAAAVAAARRIGDEPLLLSLLPGAAPLAEAVAAARDHGVDLLALNCGDGPGGMEAGLAQLRELWDGPLGCWPNAGATGPEEPAGIGPIGPEDFAAGVAELARRFDLRLVGGCCGTSPAHLRALARRLGRPDSDGFYAELESEDELDDEPADDDE
ncbi:homocysteine S-methyltransferase family protein [Engelhardtia mirabilis]|uniref:Bifunctional homocysteine S-methyltransferase/5,10-methylenetetrahydrofolate reductase n=1 Tax=Engelhardtia mirabilis TaxID=2528011 RepID=A0A518BR16_9BACT|nr:Bifunctional homocysteine S-methyltransferase/5,10-methylenetetrahydrofolate reductase [Planctomycetes bacterium Pla133]QDV03716.1 Bifunctional homocysteine S-methyltransferase/5,10-methylenetetrahydrofolate reductase [Planctomycetes bacterium Pla86]